MNDKSDPTTHDTGSVADEAIKLMESLGAWATGAQQASTTSQDRPAGSGTCSCSTDSAAPQSHAPAVCRVCPVCRVGAFLEDLSPEVMERFADLIAMVAGSLQAVAQQRRSEHEAPPAAAAPEQPATHKVRVTGDAPDGADPAAPAGSAE